MKKLCVSALQAVVLAGAATLGNGCLFWPPEPVDARVLKLPADLDKQFRRAFPHGTIEPPIRQRTFARSLGRKKVIYVFCFTLDHAYLKAIVDAEGGRMTVIEAPEDMKNDLDTKTDK
ncbi:MAG: hypothetical protein QGH60_22260 [Phycisphaerae bacterium]|jgi:hypothetical protein|nr:hypothetical protein [Phycisphaerae bacterium]